MARVQYKEKCKVCKDKWVLAVPRKYTICLECQMKQIFSEDIEDKKYQFLNKVSKETYEKSSFLRDIRRSYIMYKDLSKLQIDAFKKTVKEIEKKAKTA
ncbi:hypothetical protein ISS07_04345 [Candidatus Woesearchaeota archaeon]|nr:hypothetical protein [Candidatus Woesearchaeota archaeon]